MKKTDLINYLTPIEYDRALQRQAIAIALKSGWTYEEIENELKTSTATISLVKKMIGGD